MGAASAALLTSRTKSPIVLPLTIASDKSGVGHTEPAAGMSGVVHAIMAASARLALPIVHLDSLNPYLLGTLGAVDRVSSISIPRQARGALVVSRAASPSSYGHCAVTGVSSFAFQVSRSMRSCACRV